jgi:hypothetical protein
MAIGSAPEIGAQFKTGVWSTEESSLWREQVGGDLLGGYAKLCYPRFPVSPDAEVCRSG